MNNAKPIAIATILAISVSATVCALDTQLKYVKTRAKNGSVMDSSLTKDVSDNGKLVSSLDSNLSTGAFFLRQFFYSGTNLIRFEARPKGVLDPLYSSEYGFDSQNRMTTSVIRKTGGDTNFTSSYFYRFQGNDVEQLYRDSTGATICTEKIKLDSCQNVVGKEIWKSVSGTEIRIDRKFIYNGTCGDTAQILTYSPQTSGMVSRKETFANHRLLSSVSYSSPDTSNIKVIDTFSYPSSSETVSNRIEIGAMGSILNRTKTVTKVNTKGYLTSKVVKDDLGGADQGRFLEGAYWSFSSADSLMTFNKFDKDSVELCGDRVKYQRDAASRITSSVSYSVGCDTLNYSTITYQP